MTSQQENPNCVRGYVFLKVSNGQYPEQVAINILKLEISGTKLDFIIRADTMKDLTPDDPSPYDIVVTVNAADDKKFGTIAKNIRGVVGVDTGTTALVDIYQTHSDERNQPHITPGYVSDTEFGKGNPLANPGTQDHNVWG